MKNKTRIKLNLIHKDNPDKKLKHLICKKKSQEVQQLGLSKSESW